MECSRWSSERSERTPPDHVHQTEGAPEGARETGDTRPHRPIRGGCLCGVVIRWCSSASGELDHRLHSIRPSGPKKKQRIIIPVTVQEILDEQIAHKLA